MKIRKNTKEIVIRSMEEFYNLYFPNLVEEPKEKILVVIPRPGV